MLKIYSKGNELKREVLDSMDIVFVCENGVELLVTPRLEGGEIAEESVKEIDDENLLPKIDLRCIGDPRVKLNFWMQDVVHKEVNETEGHVHSIHIRYLIFSLNVYKKLYSGNSRRW